MVKIDKTRLYNKLRKFGVKVYISVSCNIVMGTTFAIDNYKINTEPKFDDVKPPLL